MFNKKMRLVRQNRQGEIAGKRAETKNHFQLATQGHQGMHLLHHWYSTSSSASLRFRILLVQCRIISLPLFLSSIHRKFSSNAQRHWARDEPYLTCCALYTAQRKSLPEIDLQSELFFYTEQFLCKMLSMSQREDMYRSVSIRRYLLLRMERVQM